MNSVFFFLHDSFSATRKTPGDGGQSPQCVGTADANNRHRKAMADMESGGRGGGAPHGVGRKKSFQISRVVERNEALRLLGGPEPGVAALAALFVVVGAQWKY
jgi:hypothetical protein